MHKKLFLFGVSLLLVSVGFEGVFAAPDRQREESRRVRVVTESRERTEKAVEAGCELKKERKRMAVLICSDGVASSLGLEEDIPVFTEGRRDQEVFVESAAANSQINANTVHVSGNTGVGRKIVVLDTGYNYLHPELSASSSYGGGRDFVNNDNDPMDDNGHGSHVAGLITGDGVNAAAKGTAPGAVVVAGKVLDAAGSGYFSDVTEAIYWAVDGPDGVYGTSDDFGADAISMSLGTGAPYLYKGFCDSVIPSLTSAIKYAVDRGILVVAAAGNSGGGGVSLPGCVSHSTTVGAVDSKNRVAYFSGRGNAVDISAPGVSLLSAWTGSSYVYASGTSMATPIVSAVAALIKSAHPAYSFLQVQDALFKTAKDFGSRGKDSQYGWGRVEAQKAVAY